MSNEKIQALVKQVREQEDALTALKEQVKLTREARDFAIEALLKAVEEEEVEREGTINE